MESLQEKFILKQLNNYNSSEMYSKNIDTLGDLSRSCISRIFNQKNIISTTDMKALFCLFDTMFLSESKIKSREKGLYDLSKTIEKWIKKMVKISVNSKEGFIYISNFSPDIQVVIKVAQKSNGLQSKLREYFIGIKSLNKLRCLIPTFVYTIGSFLYPKPTKTGKIDKETENENTAFVVYEKIDGETINSLLKKDKLNFKQFLSIFIQLLLGLEVAQREARFTHFDLHTDNVMIRETDISSYNVHLDMSTYNVINPEFIPVIIDFGTSTCFIENRYIGSYDYMKYGMLNFMVPGYDMYKFLVYCARKTTNKELKQKIISIFLFYEDNEPYDIINNIKGIDKAVEEYCMNTTFSKAATYTPLIFIEWLLKEYWAELKSNILVSERVNYLSLRYSSITKEYNHIFEYIKEGVDNAILFTEECTPSYVMTKYNINLLERYNDNLQSHELSRKIKDLNKYLHKFEDKFIDIDKAMLENVFDIKIPTQKDLDLCINNLIGIKIRCPKPIDKEKAVKDLDIILSYQENLKPHLQFYFTILELNLKEVFSVWIKKFKESRIYLFHIKNVIKNERAKRWSQTLMASII
jgi:serine/threonine protein kinase